MKRIGIALAVAGLCLSLSLSLVAQAEATKFEVAAIKPGMAGTGSGLSLPATGRFQATNVTLASLIPLAFGVNAYQVSGGPEWMSKQLFSIQAKAPGDGPVSRPQYLPMLRDLLTDRFKLQIARRSDTISAYALMSDKKASTTLKVSSPGTPAKEVAGSVTGTLTKGVQTGLEFTGYSMPAFVTRLSFYLKNLGKDATPVIDQTGLTGIYDFALPPTLETGGGQDSPSIFTILKDIGLRLEKGKYPVETLVIESAQVPAFDN